MGCGLRLRVNNLRAGVAFCAHVQHHTCTGEEIKGGRRGHVIRKMCSSAILDWKTKLKVYRDSGCNSYNYIIKDTDTLLCTVYCGIINAIQVLCVIYSYCSFFQCVTALNLRFM